MRIYAGLGAEEPRHQLFGGHFETEYAGDHPIFGCILGHVQGQGGLAHGRPRRNDYEILSLKPGSHLVEVGETGGDASYHFWPAGHLFYLLQPPARNLTNWPETLANAIFSDLKDQPFSFIDDCRRFVLLLDAPGDDLVRCRNQPPKHRL